MCVTQIYKLYKLLTSYDGGRSCDLLFQLLYTDTPLELAGLVSSCLWQEAQLVRLSTGQVRMHYIT